jgi:hypothetical protein
MGVGAEDDDDIQEVVPAIVKSEPRDAAAAATAAASSMVSATTEDGVSITPDADYGESSRGSDGHGVGGGEVALEDSYQDESYDYGGAEYGDVNFVGGDDDGSGQVVIDPNTGLPLGAAGAADGNKGRISWNNKYF